MNNISNLGMMSDARLLRIALDAETEMIEKVEAVGRGHAAGLIISGPPGVGKTATTRSTLTKMPGLAHIEDVKTQQDMDRNSPTYKQWFEVDRIVDTGPLLRKSTYSTWSLVRDLWRNRNTGNILMIDDNDAALQNITFCNVIMSATEQEANRQVHYTLKQLKELEAEAVPTKFDYDGGIIMLTNYNMLNVPRAGEAGFKSYHEKWRAITSRLSGSYVDMNLDGRALIVYLEHKVRSIKFLENSELFQKNFQVPGITADQVEEVCDLIRDMVQANALKQDLDLRTYNAVAANVIISDGNSKVWRAKTIRDLCIKGANVV